MARKKTSDPHEARTPEGRDLQAHTASYNLQKNMARLARDAATQRDYREGADEAELGARVAGHLRMENYPRTDRR